MTMSRIVPLREPGVGLRRRQQAGQHRGGDREHRRRQDRQRADDDRRRSRRRRARTAATPAASAPRAAAIHQQRRARGAAVAVRAPRASGAAAGSSSPARPCPVIATGSSTSAICCFGEDLLLANQLEDAAAGLHRFGRELGRAVVADHRIERGDGADAVLDVVPADVGVGRDARRRSARAASAPR